MPTSALVITVSDRCHAGQRADLSGPAAATMLQQAGFTTQIRVIPDGAQPVRDALSEALASGVRMIVTSGGTGVGPRDRTPEGTRAVIERELPGIGELLRAAPGKPHAYLSRGLAGVAGDAFIVNMPGNPDAVRESLQVVLPLVPHILDQLGGGDH